jgi:hypothetical protein
MSKELIDDIQGQNQIAAVFLALQPTSRSMGNSVPTEIFRGESASED